MRQTLKLVLILVLQVSVESAKNIVFLNLTCQNLDEKVLKFDVCRIRPDKTAKSASTAQRFMCWPHTNGFPHRYVVQAGPGRSSDTSAVSFPSRFAGDEFECESLYCLAIDKSLMTNQ